MNAFVSLCDADEACGSKAAVLGELSRAGFAVPDGFVLPIDPGDGWERELPDVLDALGGSSFAVRSSGMAEDGRESSFAGQFHTRLEVEYAEVEAEVRRTRGAVAKSHIYASAVGKPVPRHVAVIVQRMLSPSAAGVTFTVDPVTGRRDLIVEAVRGFGDRLVSGDAHAERWRFRPEEEPRRQTEYSVLDPAQAAEIGRTAISVEEHVGGPQDVEWAIAGDRVWLLQARPVTAPVTIEYSPAAPKPNVMTPTAGTASGTPSSPGTARGRLRIISGFDDFSRFEAGDVLVCEATSPAWAPLLARASAIITTRGGVLSHAAIIAREFRIPAITDMASAMCLPDDALVVVDGTTGTITLKESQ